SSRYKETSAATVIKLRSRFDRPGRSHISPNSTLSVTSASFGATCPNTFCPNPTIEVIAHSPRVNESIDNGSVWHDDSFENRKIPNQYSSFSGRFNATS